MAKMKRFTCTACAAQGINSQFVSQSALEMHMSAKHVRRAPPRYAASNAQPVPPEIVAQYNTVAAPRSRRNGRVMVILLVLGMITVSAIAAWPVMQHYFIGGDPTAQHD